MPTGMWTVAVSAPKKATKKQQLPSLSLAGSCHISVSTAAGCA
jgi:hypothetical protein